MFGHLFASHIYAFICTWFFIENSNEIKKFMTMNKIKEKNKKNQKIQKMNLRLCVITLRVVALWNYIFTDIKSTYFYVKNIVENKNTGYEGETDIFCC